MRTQSTLKPLLVALFLIANSACSRHRDHDGEDAGNARTWKETDYIVLDELDFGPNERAIEKKRAPDVENMKEELDKEWDFDAIMLGKDKD
jgi:hypothetical protein